MNFVDKLINSFFQSVTLRTAGFNTVPLTNIRPATVFISIAAFIPISYKFLLKAYQKDRIDTFLNPELDALGTYAEEEHLKKQFDEIKEMINVLSKPS